VIRDGYGDLCYYVAGYCRSAYRGVLYLDPGCFFIGFRVLLAPGQP
jgi:hypothetical protein